MQGSLVGGEVIEPYATALMATAQNADLVDRLGADVRLLLDLLVSSSELGPFLGNPLVKAVDKKAVLRRLVGQEVHGYTLNFLLILVDRGRILFLEGICQRFLTLVRQLRGIALVEVTSVVELSQDQQQAIADQVVAFTRSQKAEVVTRLDPDLLGGLIIKVGSQVIDGSLRGQLRRIGLSLGSAPV